MQKITITLTYSTKLAQADNVNHAAYYYLVLNNNSTTLPHNRIYEIFSLILGFNIKEKLITYCLIRFLKFVLKLLL